jgi:TrmH family RNA methyltransferase
LSQPTELDGLRVVLVSTRNPLNLGAAARAMSNFGALQLRVVNPYEVAFREARSAVGRAAEVLRNAEEFTTLARAVADCGLVVGTTAIQHRDLQHPLYRLDEGAVLVRQQMTATSVALVFGSEKTGLSNEDLAHCHWLMHIPTRDEHLSMNLGQAVAVILYELWRQPAPVATVDQPVLATAAELERVTLALIGALQRSGYTSSGSLTTAEERVRRLLRRMSLNARDAELLLGMLRQIDWKLRSESDETKS